MARIIAPGSTRSTSSGRSPRRPFFATDLVRRHGLRAVVAIAVVAAFAFAPLTALYWFASFSQNSAVAIAPGQRMVVKPDQRAGDHEREEPGETALLQVRCDVPCSDGWQELVNPGDAMQSGSSFHISTVREERVYIRCAGSSVVPWALVGAPPVSVWLPAGHYEVLVVYRAPTGESRIDAPGRAYPWLSAWAACSLESRQTTVCRAQLPHYEWGNPDVQLDLGSESESAPRAPTHAELAAVLESCEITPAIPTPAGFLLTIVEPRLHHRDGHRHCVQDFYDTEAMPREWTREQLATLRYWLPEDAIAAKARLSALIDRLGWREFLQGSFCFAAAAITGLVFTRWGAIAWLEPWRRRDAWYESFGLFFRIALLAVAGWFALQILWALPVVRELAAFRLF